MSYNCYKFKKYNYNNPIFYDTIDATYVINLENNGRLNNIIKQLSTYHPTKIIYICFNKGYKKCKKQKFITNPPLDLVDCNINIFKHAKSLNYNNILVLEDDFIFNKEIKNKTNINNINDFINTNHNFCYLLGCLPMFMIPYNFNTYQYLISGGMHAVIYSKKYRNNILNLNQKDIHDWDLYSWKFIKNRYCYYKPLCYQLFPHTENSDYWGMNTIFKYVMKYILVLTRHLFKIFQLDKKPEPGFSYFYFFGKILPLIILYFIINVIQLL